jgi:hypothetical protein
LAWNFYKGDVGAGKTVSDQAKNCNFIKKVNQDKKAGATNIFAAIISLL